MPFHKILVPTDFSQCAQAALAAAVEIARRDGASIDVVHIHEPPYSVGAVTVHVPGVGDLAMADYMEQQAGLLLEQVLADQPIEGLTVTRTLLAGLPEKVIIEHALAGGHDLLVLGTHGRRGFSRFLMGSVTERVLRQAPAAVLVVRDHYGPEAPVQKA